MGSRLLLQTSIGRAKGSHGNHQLGELKVVMATVYNVRAQDGRRLKVVVATIDCKGSRWLWAQGSRGNSQLEELKIVV